jgi:uncharacterized membrane protein
MALDTYMVFASQYNNEEDALADYEAVCSIYTSLGIVGTYDAAVLTRDEYGKVRIVKRVLEPVRHSPGKGAPVGLATGAAVALFPALSLCLEAEPSGGRAIGAAADVVASHVVHGMKRSDLKDLGDLLDNGTSGLLVVAAQGVEARVRAGITRAGKRAMGRLRADEAALERATDRAA